jgi:hypothetical protein
MIYIAMIPSTYINPEYSLISLAQSTLEQFHCDM